jgi:hypothetical protein
MYAHGQVFAPTVPQFEPVARGLPASACLLALNAFPLPLACRMLPTSFPRDSSSAALSAGAGHATAMVTFRRVASSEVGSGSAGEALPAFEGDDRACTSGLPERGSVIAQAAVVSCPADPWSGVCLAPLPLSVVDERDSLREGEPGPLIRVTLVLADCALDPDAKHSAPPLVASLSLSQLWWPTLLDFGRSDVQVSAGGLRV